nr:histone H2AX-like [Tanacetum cinerariifolium]
MRSEGKGERGKPKSSKSMSRSQKAGIKFPVGRIARFLKVGKYAERIGAGAPVYLAAVLEYLAVEVLELAGNAARDNKKSRIVPRHIQLAVMNDEELSKLFETVTIANAAPSYHPLESYWDTKDDAPGPRRVPTLTAVAQTKTQGPRLILFGGAIAIEGIAASLISGIKLCLAIRFLEQLSFSVLIFIESTYLKGYRKFLGLPLPWRRHSVRNGNTIDFKDGGGIPRQNDAYILCIPFTKVVSGIFRKLPLMKMEMNMKMKMKKLKNSTRIDMVV